MELKDASLPDHAHQHNHDGVQEFKINYQRGPSIMVDSGKSLGWGSGSMSKKHSHNVAATTEVNIDFSKMNPSEAFISRITNPKVSKSTQENELYSPHMRVKFMFKCLWNKNY